MTSSASVAATPEVLGTLLPNNMEIGGSTTAAPSGSGPSLESLVDVIRNGQGGVVPSSKSKAKAKPKSKKAATLEEAKTPAEMRDAIRSLAVTHWHLFEWASISPKIAHSKKGST